MSRSTTFWNRYADRYAKMAVPDPVAYRQKLKRTRAYLTPASRVLEIGCGTGSTAIAHAPHVARIDAVDFSEKMIQIAQAKAAAARIDNIGFREAALEELGPGDYDMVLALNLIQLLPDPEGGVEQMAGMLRPGGVLVTSTLCLGTGGAGRAMRWLLAPFAAMGSVPRLSFFDRDRYLRMFESAGLEVVESWSPGRRRAWFDVARRPGGTEAAPPATGPDGAVTATEPGSGP